VTLTIDPVAICLTTDAADVVIVLIAVIAVIVETDSGPRAHVHGSHGWLSMSSLHAPDGSQLGIHDEAGATVAAVTLTIDPVAICLTTDAADVVIVLIAVIAH
jgi:hypothetical protein